ncbi:hypothetical protein AFLA_000875 [Aspergillus flavus NRRL3357]|nr:hypothetical protein AFLA_000875 [Aspergillus flavus NRRL3357]
MHHLILILTRLMQSARKRCVVSATPCDNIYRWYLYSGNTYSISLHNTSLNLATAAIRKFGPLRLQTHIVLQ